MKATLILDANLIDSAREYTGLSDLSEIVDYALQRLVQAEAAKSLARLGGSQPDFVAAPRRRFKPAE